MNNKGFQTGKVVLLSFSHFIHDIYTSFLSPLLPLLIERLSLSLSQAGLLSTVMQVPALLNPFIGVLADSKGLARWLVILAPTITAIPMSFIGMASSYATLLVLVFIAGTSVALFHVPAPVMVAQLSGDKKGQGMSFFMTGGESARTLGPMIAVAFVTLFGLDNFYIVLIFAVLTSIFLFFTLEKVEKIERVKKNGALLDSYKEVKHVMLPLAGMLTARACMHASLGMFLTVFIERQTNSLWLGGAALALYEAFGVAGILSAGTLSDRFGRKILLFTALTIAPVAIILFIMTTGFLKIFMLVLAGFTVLSTTPVMLAIVQDHAKEHPSTANGLFMMISFAVRSFAVVVVGFIGDVAGLENMFIISGLLGFAAIPFLLKFKN